MDKILKIPKIINKNSKKISFLTFLILFAFFGGNIFGIYLKNVDNFYLIIILVLLSLEIISFLKYSNIVNLFIINKNSVIQYLNVLKRGFLIGLFVEAFKVGS